MFKKSLPILMSALILATAASGCSSSKGKNATTSTDQKETVTLTYLTSVNVSTEGQSVSDNDYLKYIEEKNNVKINIISEATNYSQKMYTVMASGDLPDYLMVNSTNPRNDLAQFATEGLLLPLDSYVAKSDNLKSDISSDAWNMSKVNGKIYAIPMERYDRTPLLTFVRKDWLQNLNIDPTKLKTIDDYYNMFKEFTYNDPDKDGKNDTVGIAATNAVNITLETFMDSFNADKYQVVNGQMIPYYLTSGYENWLKFMNKLYSEKILDNEYLTNTKQQMLQKFDTGKYGGIETFWSLQDGTLHQQMNNLVALKPPAKADGSDGKYFYQSGPVRHYIAVTKNCKHPDRVVSIMNWACSDEGAVFVNLGLEGKDYNTVNSKPEVKTDRAGLNWAWRFITLGIQKPKIDDQMKNLLTQAWGQDGYNLLQLSNKYGTTDDFANQVPYYSELSDYDLNSKVQEYTNQAIMGKVNIDTTWDSYVSNIKKAGGDQLIKLYTDWYNNTYKKQK